MILSASRRTDIPSYYSEWFINRLRAGIVLTRNPMNHAQVSKISLSPEVIDCIVFWTKDPANMLDKLPILDEMGYKYYFQFTLNPYGKDIERNLTNKMEIIKTFIQLSKAIGKEKVLWRYDPIILNDSITIKYHTKIFEKMCSILSNYTNICTISFIDLYSKLNSIIKSNLIREINETEIKEIAAAFAKITCKYNIELRACCEKMDLSNYDIHPASCIDKNTIEKICGYTIDGKNDTNQRSTCGCIQSIDIGAYNTCKNGCLYCYANHSDFTIETNCKKHDPKAEILIGKIHIEEKIFERKVKSLKLMRGGRR